MVVGIVARKKSILTSEASKSLSDFLLNITLPLLIISSFNYNFSEEMFIKAKLVFIYSILIHIVLILASWLLCAKFSVKSKKVLRFVTIFSNSGFMGYPVLEQLFGKVGVFYGAIFNIPFNIFVLSYGVMIYTGKKDIKTIRGVITHPGIVATVFGFIMFIFSIKLPDPIYEAASMVGSMTTPLSMLIVGCMLAEIKYKEVFSGIVAYYASVIRLIVAPFIVMVLLKLMHADKLVSQICITVEAMPAAVLATVLAEKYGADALLASKCVLITTIISMLTIPLVLMTLY